MLAVSIVRDDSVHGRRKKPKAAARRKLERQQRRVEATTGHAVGGKHPWTKANKVPCEAINPSVLKTLMGLGTALPHAPFDQKALVATIPFLSLVVLIVHLLFIHFKVYFIFVSN